MPFGACRNDVQYLRNRIGRSIERQGSIPCEIPYRRAISRERAVFSWVDHYSKQAVVANRTRLMVWTPGGIAGGFVQNQSIFSARVLGAERLCKFAVIISDFASDRATAVT